MKYKLSILLFIFTFFYFNKSHAQLSKKHFIPPLTYAETGNANPENQYFYISTPSNKNVNYTIKQIGSPSNNLTGIVTSTSPKEIPIGNGDSQLFVDSRQTSVVHNNKGYIIEANDVIYVSIRVLAGGGAQAGALVSKGASALGTTFRAGMFTNANAQTNYLNFISVMATEDNTKITFDDLPIGMIIKNYNSNSPITTSKIENILLNEGESYVLATNSADNEINKDGLIGTLITTDDDEKPIVVNTGSANGSFHDNTGRDYGIDQIVGADKIGTDYIFVKGNGSDGWENILIVAHEDDTTISLKADGVIATIDKGEYYLIEGDEYDPTNGNLFVKTSKPIFAYQGIGANNSEANQGLFFVPPLSCENRGKVDNIPNIESIGTVDFTGGITIVTNKNATVNINSQPIANFTTSGPFDVVGNANYVTYKVINLSGNISIDSSEELYCAYFNQNGSASSGSFYSGFPSSPEINFNTSVSSLGNCIPNITLQAANTDLFDGGIEWFFDDGLGGGFVTTNITDTSYKPTQPGNYQLVGKIICSSAPYFSAEIPVSICPDDFDGDLIIDNFDIDIDNDGILNCDESLGNVTIKLVDLDNAIALNPSTNVDVINFSKFTSDQVGNSIIGDNSGNFTSTISPVVDSKLQYELKTSQNINFKFTQNKFSDHTITDGEFFILKVNSNKNITLLDPDDQLLIYNVAKDEFESGLTNITASVIQYKYKANTTGASSTFKFIASQVTQIDFKHQSSGITSLSTFNGTIELTCFSLDSDGDGIENMFDIDSDNDGIPDIYEASSSKIILLNTDADLDGLDDAFTGITTNIDTDNDNIPNYLDLDADNDGIFDLVEANHAGTDANNDGVLDDANAANVGENGLLNSLETAIDNNTLSYIIADSDSDNIFNFLELDADNDACFDTTEAGFTDPDNDGYLGNSPVVVESDGRIKNHLYTNPTNDNYTISAPIEVTNFSDITFCESDTDTITIESTATSYQWQVFNGTNWQNIDNNDLTDAYEDAKSKDLKIINTPLSFNNNTYRVLLNKTGNSCEKISNEIKLTVNPKPVLLNAVVQLKQCADNIAETTIVNLTEAEKSISTDPTVRFEYYETEQKAIDGGISNQVSDEKKYPVTKIAFAWVRTISDKECYTISKIEITASFVSDILYDKVFEDCDDLLDDIGNDSNNDGVTNFDFSLAEQEVKNSFPNPDDIEVFFYETIENRDAAINAIPDITKHRNNSDISYAFNQTIYIKIKNKNNNNCEGIGKLFLKTSTVPEFSVEGENPDNPIIICTKNIPYTLSAEYPLDDYDYIWTKKSGTPITPNNTQSIQIKDAGEYTVTAFSRNSTICKRSKTIFVQKSNFGALDLSFVTISDDTSGTSNNLSIEINIPTNPLINEEFLYALESESGSIIRNYQESNIFNNIEGGIYKILVENKNGCGSSELIVSVIQFPKFFTPNADGDNDYWVIKGANSTFYSTNSSISIFNRFGKLLAKETIDSQGWNGIYGGKLLPSNDYWYTITLIPTDTSKPIITKKGNFTLIRKNK